jgi:hypothetical protein
VPFQAGQQDQYQAGPPGITPQLPPARPGRCASGHDESCLAYLIPGGGSIQKVEWDDGPAAANQVTAYFDHPIVWAGD